MAMMTTVMEMNTMTMTIMEMNTTTMEIITMTMGDDHHEEMTELMAIFNSSDADGDGFLNLTELEYFIPAVMGLMITMTMETMITMTM